MTLASLINEGPVLNISFTRRQDSSSCVSWSDFPVVGGEEIYTSFSESPLEQNPFVIEKVDESIRVSPPSALSWDSTLSWSDFPIIGCPNDNGQSHENRPFRHSRSASTMSSSASSKNNATTLNTMEFRRKHRKTVSFDNFLEIRQHALTIGDHPLCRDSLPISLAWEHGDTELIDLEGFEAQRKGLRRTGNEMRLSYFERKNILRNIGGLSEADMRDEQKRVQNSF